MWTNLETGYIANAGKAFQVKDDVINLDSADFKQDKGSPGEDISEGKITLMTIHFANTYNAKSKKIQGASFDPKIRNEFFQILRAKTFDARLINWAIEV